MSLIGAQFFCCDFVRFHVYYSIETSVRKGALEMERKVIPIGYEDIREIIDKNLYYVDKSLLIRELLDSGGKVSLVTRPRRFGKTLNLSMLRRFFEDERTPVGEKVDNGYVFNDLAILSCGERYLQHQQQYPVINLSLKSAKQPSFAMAYACLVDEIIKEFQRHAYILEGEMPVRDRENFELVLRGKGEDALYAKALGFLSECLARYHENNVIILIDEYDVPLENAYFEGFYDQMIRFIRSLFESALKTNPFLELGVITGCLRISRESIFTGLNNLQIHSVLSPRFADCFGFTEEEVGRLLDYYGLSDKYSELRLWYDGYRFTDVEIYNPWSILNYIDMASITPHAFPRPYWSNTSSNSIIRELVEEADGETRKELEALMNGGTIEKPVHEEITYGDIHISKDNLWNFLFFTGYLTMSGQRMEGEDIYLSLSIPNGEIRSVYRQSILQWFDRKIRQTDRRPFIKALEEGDCKTAEEFICRQLLDTISYFDYAEKYYHGFLAGLFAGFEDYEVLSNRESGTGRPDLMLKTRRIRDGRAIVLEQKAAQRFDQMEEKCKEALEQIEKQNYEGSLRDEGYAVIEKYGICFYRKECMIQKAK